MIPDHQGRSFDGMQGGSDSDSALRQGNVISFFQKDVKWAIPTEKKRLQGRILPARDNTLSKNDSAWPTSVLPYRDRASGLLDDLTKTSKFNAFYAAFNGYKFFGRTQASLVSPQTLKALVGGVTAADIADPIVDCRNYCRNHADPDLRRLVEKEGNDKRARAVIPHYQSMALLNMYCAEDRGEWATRIVTVAGGAIEDLKRKLSWQTPRGQDKAHDPNWDEFLYGDVTDLQTGLIATLIPISVGVTTPTGFSFSNRDYVLDGSRKQPVDAAELTKRYDLLSSATLRIETYQELVNFLVDDGTIPYAVIQAACGNMATVPKPPKQGVVTSSPAPQPAQAGVPGLIGSGSGQPAVDTRKFWVVGPGGITIEGTAENVQALVNAGQNPQMINYDQSGGWKTAQEFGFSKPAPAAPTPPPAPVAPPAAPTPPTPPPAPAAPTPPLAPAPEPVKALRKFWMALAGAPAKEASEDEVQAAVDNGISAQVMNYDQSGGWQKPEALGFKKDEIDTTPTLPAAPTPPTPPPAPVAPATPQPPTAPAAPAAPTPSGSYLTAEETTELESLKGRSTNPGGPGGPLQHLEMMRLIELTRKSTGVS